AYARHVFTVTPGETLGVIVGRPGTTGTIGWDYTLASPKPFVQTVSTNGTDSKIVRNTAADHTGDTYAGGGESITASRSVYDCGGGRSDSGEFQLHGTIGQPDARTVSNGEWTIEGGFWTSGGNGDLALSVGRSLSGVLNLNAQSDTVTAAILQVSTDLETWQD